MKKAQKTKKGFSIGEVLVAMFILLVGIVDAVFLTVRSVNDLGISRDSVVATLLAQEGTELVRNIRDNTVTESTCGGGSVRCSAFEGHGSMNFPSVGSTEICTLDYDLDSTSGELDCTGVGEGELYKDRNSGFFSHDSGGDYYRNFRRKVQLHHNHFSSTSGVTSPDDEYVDVVSIVIFGKAEWSDVDFGNIEETCKKSKNCAFAETRLSSWINFGD